MTENVSPYPLSCNVLAAAAIVKSILDCAGAETNCGASQHKEKQQQQQQQQQHPELGLHRPGHDKMEPHHQQVSLPHHPAIDQIHEQRHQEKENQRPEQHQCQHQRQGQEQEHQQQWDKQQALPLEIQPSRRANRPHRKRRKHIHVSHERFKNIPGDSGLLQLAAAGLDNEENVEERKDVTAQPLRPSYRSSDLGRSCNHREANQGPFWSQRQNEMRDPGCLAHSSKGEHCAPSSSPSSLLPPSFACGQQCRGQPPFSAPTTAQPRSTIRLISSETYLRRLFVTASLAHVLSLDECLPRSMVLRKRASTSRAVVREGNEENRHEEEDKKQKRFAKGDGVGSDGTSSDENTFEDGTGTDKPPRPTAFDSGTFKKYYPVTLIDAKNQRWSVLYVTNRRDNLHSGRLIDGWEKFCYANDLRIGDEVEFTKMEEEQEGQRGTRSRKEAVARVAISRRRSCAFRALGR